MLPKVPAHGSRRSHKQMYCLNLSTMPYRFDQIILFDLVCQPCRLQCSSTPFSFIVAGYSSKGGGGCARGMICFIGYFPSFLSRVQEEGIPVRPSPPSPIPSLFSLLFPFPLVTRYIREWPRDGPKKMEEEGRGIRWETEEGFLHFCLGHHTDGTSKLDTMQYPCYSAK